jgi:primosomal protein N' (replication factor Y) (superfamily II helicase)
VALDVPMRKLFDYVIPEGMEITAGDRVTVPFGPKQHIGIVVEHTEPSELPSHRLRSILEVRKDAPPLPGNWLRFMEFLAGYYQRPFGETLIASLPPRLRSIKPLPKKALARATTLPTKSGAEPALTFAPNHQPTPAQRAAIERVQHAFASFRPFLLHGVTGSGKTEVYLNLIAQVLETGGQALVLVPEISLTPQLETTFRQAFPQSAVVVLHSAMQDVPRTAAWLQAATGEAAIVLGTRLAVLAPLPQLGIVIVDEEHDSSFKQQEGLRYSGRDAAVYRAKLTGCPVVLGTATPSLESWQNYKQGRYEYLPLPERAVPGATLPSVRIIDLRRQPADQGLAPSLFAAIQDRLQRGEQSLVFINRRGYSPVLACEACGWRAGCTRCTAAMVVHATDRRLRCHHCGAEDAIPAKCPTCGNVDLKPMGRGTQRIEETLAARFPGARIVRVDRDTARDRAELSRSLENVRRGEGDILVGTQLLAKGHDFPALTLVGVLNADTALLSTDYRSAERLFAVLAQVAGRAGRHARPGEVFVQTRYPDHPLFAALARHDFAGFADSQLEERRSAGFPPFVFEAALRAEAKKLDVAMQFLQSAATLVSAPSQVRIYDPVPHVITRRAGLERAQLLVQSSSRGALQSFLAAWSESLAATAPRTIRWHLDVDPIEFD